MKKFAYILLALSFACLPAFATDFSDFERSLMGGADNASVADSSAQDDGVENQSSDAMVDFEKSLVERPSDMEPVYTLREDLLEAVKKKDSRKAAQLMDQLQDMQTRSVLPIQPFEKEFVSIELGMYDRLMDNIVKYYRTVLDTDLFDKDVKVAEKDGLYLHILEYTQSLDSTKRLYEIVNPKVANSKLPDVKRRKLEILLMLHDAYRDTKTGENVLSLAEEFVNKYPDDPDTPWMKHSIIGPLSRMSIFDFKMQKRGDLKEGIIRNKLYTGGIGFNIYFAMGGLGLGVDDLYRSDLYEAEPVSANWELYAQFSRFALSFEMVNSGISGLTSLGLGLGWVVYDSRYLKLRPYFGIGIPFMNYSRKPESLRYDGEGEVFSSMEGNRFSLGVNVDFKFLTTYLFISSSKLSSFSLVGKFGVSSIEADTDIAKGDGFDAFFCLGLGIYLW